MERTGPGLRELKKERTRRSLLLAAYRLFEEKGYDATTISEIARAAEVSQGTFFNYFGTKEDLVLVFGDHADIAEAGLEVLHRRGPHDRPVDAIARAFETMLDVERQNDPDNLAQARARLIVTVPALYARSLSRIFDIQNKMVTRLQTAFPGELDEMQAAILVGAFAGANMSAARVAAAIGVPLEQAVRAAIDEVCSRFR